MRAVWLFAAIVGLSSLTTGCRTPMAMPRPSPAPAALPVAERQIPAPDASAITDLPNLGSPNPLPAVGYYSLTAEECRRLACENSALGNLVDAGSAPSTGRGHGPAPPSTASA